MISIIYKLNKRIVCLSIRGLNWQNLTYSTLDGDLKLENVTTKSEEQQETIEISFGQLLKSTLSAFIGVQSNANRERDFKHGKISHFIGIGVLFGLLFVCSLIGIVSLVMEFAAN